MGLRHAASSALLLALGCGRVGYPALADDEATDGGGAIDGSADGGLATMDSSTLDAPPDHDGGSGMSDSATVDATMHDAGTDGGAVGAGCGPAAIFCDGFEGETVVPPWGGTIIEPGASLGRTTTTRHSGAAALEATISGELMAAFAYVPISPAVGSGDIYARAYFRFETSSLYHLDLLQLTSDSGTIGLTALYGDLVAWNALGSGEVRPAVPSAIPLGRFVCLEIHLLLDQTAGVIDAWIDGAQVLHAEGMRTMTRGTPVIEARAGAGYAGPGQPAATVYVDDVVVSRERIGCI